MQNIAYGLTPIANLVSIDVSGRPGVGASQLILDVRLILQPHAQNSAQPRIVMMTGQVRVVGDAVLAQLQPEPLDLRCPPTHALPHSAKLRALLSPSQVRAADESRDGHGSLRIIIELILQVSGPDGLMLSPVTDTKEVTASDWARVLREMEFEDRATFEVPIEGGRVAAPLDKAAGFVSAALDQLQKRDWEDALRQCREALTELEQFLRAPIPQWTDWGDKNKREGWGMQERLSAMQAAIRHVAHAGAHAKIGGADEHEVRLAVALTGAVLRYYASR